MANILLIDDHPHIGALLSEEFVCEGHAFTSVPDAKSVRQSIASFEADLVLLDLYLKREARWDVLADIKLHYPQLPVVIFTAYDGYMKDPRLAQADGFVLKSLFFDELKQEIADVLTSQSTFQPESEITTIPPLSEMQKAFN